MNYNQQLQYKTFQGQSKYYKQYGIGAEELTPQRQRNMASKESDIYQNFSPNRTDPNFYSRRGFRMEQQNQLNQNSQYKRYEVTHNFGQQSFGDIHSETRNSFGKYEEKLKNQIEMELKQYLSDEILQIQERNYELILEEMKNEINKSCEQIILKELTERGILNQQNIDQQQQMEQIFNNQQIQLQNIWQQLETLKEQQQQNQKSEQQNYEIHLIQQQFNNLQLQQELNSIQLKKQSIEINEITTQFNQTLQQSQNKYEQIFQQYTQEQKTQQQITKENNQLVNQVLLTLSQFNQQQSQFEQMQQDIKVCQLNSVAIQQLKQEYLQAIDKIQQQIINISQLEILDNKIEILTKQVNAELENIKFQVTVQNGQINYIQKKMPKSQKKLQINIIDQSQDFGITKDLIVNDPECVYQCSKCVMPIINDPLIILECHHSYHEQCIKDEIQVQLNQLQQPQCFSCNQFIKISTFQQFHDSKKLIEQLFTVQLKRIKENINYIECKTCGFFWINKVKDVVQICELCK